MRSSPIAKLVLGALLALTLSLKVWGVSDASVPHQDAATSARFSAFFARHGFEERSTEIANPVAVLGQAGTCSLLIIAAAPQGWHRDILGRFAENGDQLFFVYRGTRFQSQPVWRTRAYHYWSLIAQGVGLDAPVRLVLGVVASPTCDVNDLPWGELDELPLRH